MMVHKGHCLQGSTKFLETEKGSNKTSSFKWKPTNPYPIMPNHPLWSTRQSQIHYFPYPKSPTTDNSYCRSPLQPRAQKNHSQEKILKNSPFPALPPSLGLEWKHIFQSWGHCWVFQICWHIECSTFTASLSGFGIAQLEFYHLH